MVPRREDVADPKVEGGELEGKVSPAPGERPGGERRASVEAAQDVEEQIIRKGAQSVVTAGRPPIPPSPGHHYSCTCATNRVASRVAWLAAAVAIK